MYNKCCYSPIENRYRALSIPVWEALPVDTQTIQQWIDRGLREIEDYPVGENWFTLSGDTYVSIRKIDDGIEVYVFQIKNQIHQKLTFTKYDGCAW